MYVVLFFILVTMTKDDKIVSIPMTIIDVSIPKASAIIPVKIAQMA